MIETPVRCQKCGCPATDGRVSFTHNVADLTAQLTAVTEERDRLKVLAERAYPNLKPSGGCSRHQPPQFDVECKVCFLDLNALIRQHAEVSAKLREQVKAYERMTAAVKWITLSRGYDIKLDNGGWRVWKNGVCIGRFNTALEAFASLQENKHD